jgi:hypothetical protein
MSDHQHRFNETYTDDMGRRFGYCLYCLRDMQDLGNGLKVYGSHKRAKADLCQRDAECPPTKLERQLDGLPEFAQWEGVK